MKTLAIALIRTLAMGGITIGAVFTPLQAWLIGMTRKVNGKNRRVPPLTTLCC